MYLLHKTVQVTFLNNCYLHCLLHFTYADHTVVWGIKARFPARMQPRNDLSHSKLALKQPSSPSPSSSAPAADCHSFLGLTRTLVQLQGKTDQGVQLFENSLAKQVISFWSKHEHLSQGKREVRRWGLGPHSQDVAWLALLKKLPLRTLEHSPSNTVQGYRQLKHLIPLPSTGHWAVPRQLYTKRCGQLCWQTSLVQK